MEVCDKIPLNTSLDITTRHILRPTHLPFFVSATNVLLPIYEQQLCKITSITIHESYGRSTLQR